VPKLAAELDLWVLLGGEVVRLRLEVQVDLTATLFWEPEQEQDLQRRGMESK